MISNFPTKPVYNQGGYLSFQFLPQQLVSAFPMISAMSAVVPVALAAGAAWLKGYATKESLLYKEEPQNDAGGTYYNLTISGFVPGERHELISLMGEMADGRFLVLLKDRFGNQRLVGSPAAPLEFKAEYGSGATNADQKGFNFQFYGLSLYSSPVYNF